MLIKIIFTVVHEKTLNTAAILSMENDIVKKKRGEKKKETNKEVL